MTTSRLLPTILSLGAVGLACITATGCSSAPAGEAAASSESALTGAVTFDTTVPAQTCSPFEQGSILQAVQYARVLAGSTPFKECVSEAMRGSFALSYEAAHQTQVDTVGPYVPCLADYSGTGDEIPYASIDQQVARVLDKVLSPNDLAVSCYPADGVSEAGVDVAAEIGSGVERVSISRFLLGTPPYPLSSSEIVSLSSALLHEIMHLHNYHHGTWAPLTESIDSAKYCGVTDPTKDPSWARKHTVPRIINACVEELKVRSQQVCGGIDSCGTGADGGLQLHVPQHFSDRTYCYCAADPLTPASSGGGGGSSGPKCKGKKCFTTG